MREQGVLPSAWLGRTYDAGFRVYVSIQGQVDVRAMAQGGSESKVERRTRSCRASGTLTPRPGLRPRCLGGWLTSFAFRF